MEKQNLPKSLSHEAYGGVDGSKYIPYVSNKTGMREFTISAIIIGVILSALFAAANTYLGLMSGMTVAAGIAGAIVGAAILNIVLRRQSILETNMIQAMSSGGESVASGIIFILPAVLILGQNINPIQAIIAGMMGVLLGTGFVVLVRKYLVVEEHGKLAYPEAMAIDEVMVTSSAGGRGLQFLGIGAAIGVVVKVVSTEFLGLINTSPMIYAQKFQAQFGVSLAPALIGVGYIVGLEVGMAMLAGAILANLVFIPTIGLFGSLGIEGVLYPGTIPISEMSAGEIQANYIKYIGAGAIAMGAIITIIKMSPMIISSLKATFKGLGEKTEKILDPELPLTYTIAAVVIAFIVLAFIPGDITAGLIGATLVIVCALFFSIVAARLTGIIGTSNLPVSGMTIASLLVITPIFALLGFTDIEGMVVILMLGTAVVSAIAIGGGFTQSLKATYIIGGTTKKVQKGFIISALVGVFVVIGVILLLNVAYGFTGENALAAPQANLMAMIVQGITTGELPWVLIFAGAMIALALHFLKLPVMSVAIGFYLPVATVMAIVVGGLIRGAVEKTYEKNEKEKQDRIEKGTIVSAGLIAGESIMGILIAILMVFTPAFIAKVNIGENILPESVINSPLLGIAAVVAFSILIYYIIVKGKKLGD